MSKYLVEMRERFHENAFVGVFADTYEMASRAALAFAKAYPEYVVSIQDLTGVDPTEVVLPTSVPRNPHDVLDLSLLA